MLGSLGARVAFDQQLAGRLESGARALVNEAGGHDLALPLKLALLPAMIQVLLDRHALTPDHVAYQSMERLCLGALGLERMFPHERWANLLSFEETLRHHGGSAALHLMHGQGHARDAAAVGGGAATGARQLSCAEYFARHNFGFHHPWAVSRSLSTSVTSDGLQVHEILNCIEAFEALSRRASWCPAEDLVGRDDDARERRRRRRRLQHAHLHLAVFVLAPPELQRVVKLLVVVDLLRRVVVAVVKEEKLRAVVLPEICAERLLHVLRHGGVRRAGVDGHDAPAP